MGKKRIALIDGDIILYSVGFVSQHDPVSHALHSAKLMLANIVRNTDADDYIVYLTGKGNYREKVAKTTTYKGNRKDFERPKHYTAIREYLIKHHEAEIVDGREADDALGCKQMLHINDDDIETVICTIDKDLDMIQGLHYRWSTDTLYEISPSEADLNFMRQLMTGDPTDNIKGVPGIGKVKANKAIAKAETMSDLYWTVLEMYEKEYERPYHTMMEMADLLWIQRVEGELWDSNMAEFGGIAHNDDCEEESGQAEDESIVAL